MLKILSTERSTEPSQVGDAMVQVRGAEDSDQGGSGEGREKWIFLRKIEWSILTLQCHVNLCCTAK